jgi:hypothetical protein
MRAPWWVLSLWSGAIFAVGQFTFRRLDGMSAGPAAIGAAVGGVIFGLVMGPISRRIGNGYLEAMGDVPVSKQREVRRAVTRGLVPTDPEVRRAALSLVSYRIESFRKMRWAVVMWLFFILLSLGLTVTDSRWWALAVLLFAGFLSMHLWMPRRLRMRESLLADQSSRIS